MEGYQVDELKLYLGSDIKIIDGVVLHVPTIGEIVDYGEANYFSMAQHLCATPSTMKVMLDDSGLDYMKVDDFQLFAMICQSLPQSATKPLLGDLDLKSLKLYTYGENDIVLSNEDHSIIISEIVYQILVEYIRKMHGFKKQVDKAGNEITRKILIDEARKDAQRNIDKPFKSFLRPIISAVKCRMGYTMDYIRSMGIFELMDDLSRLNIVVQADAAMTGMYSGFVDTKKMDKTILNWTRDITEDTQNNKTILNEGAN